MKIEIFIPNITFQLLSLLKALASMDYFPLLLFILSSQTRLFIFVYDVRMYLNKLEGINSEIKLLRTR